jgi:hypothetical protein
VRLAFGGLTSDAAAEALGVAHATAEDDRVLAQAWRSRACRKR